MRVSCVLLVIAAAFVANCQGAASDSTKLAKMMPSLGQPALEHSSEQRLLRVHGTGADDEERVFDIKKLFDVKKLLGLGKKSIAVKNVEDDFAMQTIANMLKSKRIKKQMFKKWDKSYTLEDVTKELTQYSNHNRVASLLADYGKHRVPLK